jgi:hypothetical protein
MDARIDRQLTLNDDEWQRGLQRLYEEQAAPLTGDVILVFSFLLALFLAL